MPTTALMVEALMNMRQGPEGLPADKFWLLVERFRADLVHQALVMLGNQADAEDVAQETLSQAFLNLNRLRDAQKLGTWLRSINFRVALRVRQARSSRREERFSTGAQDQIADTRPPETPPPPRTPLSPEEHIYAAVDELAQPYREVVVLRYLEKLSTPEIALRLGIPEGTVRSRLTRADRLLAEKLKSLLLNQEGI